MAIPIRGIPVLEGEAARRFLKEAQKAEKERSTIDVTEQMKAWKKMWEKSQKNFMK
jgi:hypothetical protein